MDAATVTKIITVVLLCVLYIGVSSLLIRFNKFLVEPHRFPFPATLSALHMACSLFFCSIFYLVRPSAFPGMVATEGKRLDLLRWFVPIGFTFAVSLFASNQAYLYANVTFLQFMKEANAIISFLISCAVGLQVMNRVRLANILWIVTFSAICVEGEVHFVWLGFVVQGISQLAECSRVVLGECVLSGSSLKLDPLTYNLFAAPSCLAFLAVAHVFAWDQQIIPRAMQLWYLLLPNATLAFVLNLLVATVIKETSAVGFILTGVVKDIVLVVVSSLVFGETVTGQQAVGFTLVLAGILFWSFMKAMPNHPFVRWVEDRMGLPKSDEKLPLVEKSSAERVGEGEIVKASGSAESTSSV